MQKFGNGQIFHYFFKLLWLKCLKLVNKLNHKILFFASEQKPWQKQLNKLIIQTFANFPIKSLSKFGVFLLIEKKCHKIFSNLEFEVQNYAVWWINLKKNVTRFVNISSSFWQKNLNISSLLKNLKKISHLSSLGTSPSSSEFLIQNQDFKLYNTQKAILRLKKQKYANLIPSTCISIRPNKYIFWKRGESLNLFFSAVGTDIESNLSWNTVRISRRISDLINK